MAALSPLPEPELFFFDEVLLADEPVSDEDELSEELSDDELAVVLDEEAA